MSKVKKVLISLVILIIAVIAFLSIKSSYAALWGNATITIYDHDDGTAGGVTYYIDSNGTTRIGDVYCIDHSTLFNFGNPLTIAYRIHIDGNTAIVYKVNSDGSETVYKTTQTDDNGIVYSEHNGVINYIMAEADYGHWYSNGGYETAITNYFNHYNKNARYPYTVKQYAIWYRASAWLEALGITDITANKGDTSFTVNEMEAVGGVYDGVSYEGLIPKAEAYAQATTAVDNANAGASITDNTTASSVGASSVTYNGTSYVAVGPFSWTFSGIGNLEIKAYEDDNEISNLMYGVYVGNDMEVYEDTSAISSGVKFYILIRADAGIEKITKITGTATVEYTRYIADIWILSGGEEQDAITGDTLYTTDTIEIGSVTFEEEIELIGSLTVKKRDYDTGDKLENEVEFILQRTTNSTYVVRASDGTISYTSSRDSATRFTTSGGEITINNLLVGKYKVEETSVGDNYGYTTDKSNIYWSVDGGTTKTQASSTDMVVTATASGTAEIIIYNAKNTGNLYLIKQDLDNSNTVLSNVQFKIKNSSGQYIKVNNESTITGTVVASSITYSSSSSGGTTFITNSSGVIGIYNILVGTYTIEEISIGDDNYGYDEDNVYWSTDGGSTKNKVTSSTAISVQVTRQSSSATSSTSASSYTQVIVYNQKQTGTLDLIKQDLDSNSTLAEVQFKIKNSSGQYIIVNGQSTITGTVVVESLTTTTNESSATTFITDSSGEIKIVNILTGTYTIEEIYVGDANSDYYVADDDNIYWSTDGGTTKTPVTTTPITITVSTQSSSDTSSTGTTKYNQILVYNEREYVKVSGFVWEDVMGGKDNSYDSIYIEGNESNQGQDPISGETVDANDVLVEGITVRLRDTSGNTIATTTTDSNGEYLFEKVEIDNLVNYYIEFEYDGEVYTTVMSFSGLGYSNSTAPWYTSKALESDSDRSSLDGSYTDVTGKETTSASRSSDYSESYGYVDTGNSQVDITYDSTTPTDADATSTYSASKSSTSGTNTITATTRETGYNVLGGSTTVSTDLRDGTVANGVETADSIRQNGITELANRNLGLRAREQVDLSIASYLVNIQVIVNGYTHTYNYDDNVRKDQFFNDDDNEYRLAVNYKQYSVERKIYASDVVKLLEDSGLAEDTTQIFVTYRTRVINNSSTLSADINEVANYYDSRYSVVSYGSTEDLSGDITLSDTNKYNNSDASGDYNVAYAQNLGTVAAGGSLDIYIKYQLSRDAVVSILTGEYTITNVSEINGYATRYGTNTYYPTTTSKSGSLYASIDVDSAPGNLVLGNTATYEDDTAMAPPITMQLTEGGRTITGTVFEDSQTEESAALNERLGDGIYDESSEGTVGGVTVEVLYYEENTDKENLEVAKLYKYENGQRRVDDAILTTEEDGAYEFSGLIPDQYILRFTYADGTTIYRTTGETEEIKANDYKATIITSSVIAEALENNTIVGDGSTAGGVITTSDGTIYDNNKWYLIDEGVRYSDAMDSNEVVEASQTEASTINNSNYDTNSMTSKDAFSAVMNVQIEYSSNETSGSITETTSETYIITNSDGTMKALDYLSTTTRNLDFGIVEVANKSVELEKQVSNIRLILANGQVLIDGDPRVQGALDYVMYLEGEDSTELHITIDTELVYGATLEIQYEVIATNTSETNYLTEDYYRYGTDKTNVETITVNKIIDYLDNDLVFATLESGELHILAVGEDGNVTLDGNPIDVEDYLDDEVYEASQEFSDILMLISDNPIAPGEYESWTYIVSRVLSSTDDLDYSNQVEIVEITTTNTTPDDTIPGNYNPVTTQTSEPDNYEMDVIVEPPYGEDRTVTYIVIGTIALVILAAGVVVIKKKVL